MTRPIVSVTGSMSTSTRLTAGSRQSTTRVNAVEASQPRHGEQEQLERPEHHDACVEVELRALVLDPRDSEQEADDDHRVPRDRRERGQREVVVRVEDPDDDPERPRSTTIGKSTRDSPTARS